MSFTWFDIRKVSPAMKMAFEEAIHGAKEAGYSHLVLLPRDTLELAGTKLRLTMPLAVKTEINIAEITKFFLSGHVGVSMQVSEDQHLEGQSAQMRFIGFKAAEQRDALIEAIKGMEFYNEEKVYALAYGGTGAEKMGESAALSTRAYSHNLEA